MDVVVKDAEVVVEVVAGAVEVVEGDVVAEVVACRLFGGTAFFLILCTGLVSLTSFPDALKVWFIQHSHVHIEGKCAHNDHI